MKIKVNSEIGKLKKVLVHRPGKEVERLYPEVFERLLFDDIMYLPKAQEEHDYFTDKLRAEGIEVLYIEKLVTEVLESNHKHRENFINDFIKLTNVKNKAVKKAVFEFLNNIENNYELVNASIAGIEKTEINPAFENTLADRIYKEEDYPFYVDPIPNILFQRDPIASIFDGINLHPMNKQTRRREKLYYEYVFKYHPEFKDLKLIIEPSDDGSMEGGDVLVINKKTIFVGISERTKAQTVEILAKKLFKRYEHLEKVIGIAIPLSHATMHLDTVLTQMDHDKFSVDLDMSLEKYQVYELTRGEGKHLNINQKTEKIEKILQEYVHPQVKLIIVGGGSPVRAKREQWNDGANCLTIAPGKIVVYNRNYITNALIRKAGVEVIEIKSSELSRGRGGPRCMSMPLEREEI